MHAECRVNERGVYVLEVAARPIGGLCARALRLVDDEARAIGLEELLLRHALGELRRRWARRGGLGRDDDSRFRRRGSTDASRASSPREQVVGIEDVQITAKPDQQLVPLPEGASYLGFIFARADAPEAVERALRDAHRRLAFAIDRAIVVNEPRRCRP